MEHFKMKDYCVKDIESEKDLISMFYDKNCNYSLKISILKHNNFNQDFLKKLALEDKDKVIRLIAVSKVSDIKILKKVYLNDENDFVRYFAKKKLAEPQNNGEEFLINSLREYEQLKENIK